MTPYEFGLHMEGQNQLFESEQKRDISGWWHIAMLNRAKRLPKLDDLLRPKKQVQRIDGNDIFRRLDGYQKRREVLKQEGKIK